MEKFDWKIVHLEAKWHFNRIYVLTKNDIMNSIYEVDLYFRIVTLIKTFKSTYGTVIMTADPFYGYR
jgi:hypothetical protein